MAFRKRTAGGGGGGSGFEDVDTLPTGNAIKVAQVYLRTTDETLWVGREVSGTKSLRRVSSNFSFGSPARTFTTDTARDTHFTANAADLAQYDNDPNLLIQVGSGNSIEYQHRVSSAWAEVDIFLRGEKGDKGDTPAAQGQLIASTTLPTGQIAAAAPSWTLESGIPSSISLGDVGSTTDTGLFVPKSRAVNSQRGWLFSLTINDVVEAECTFDIGSGALNLNATTATMFGGSDAPDITVYYVRAVDAPYFYVVNTSFTIAATDTVKVNAYILQ